MSYRDCPQCGIVAHPHECPQTYVMQLQADLTAAREAVEAVRAEYEGKIERLHSEIRSLAENLRASATPEALGSDGWYVDMAISTLEKMVREH